MNNSKILATNSINLIGIFLSTFIFCAADAFQQQQHLDIFQILFGTLLSLIFYGILFLGIFIIGVFLLDLLLIVNSTNYLKQLLILEWLIISLPFIYWVILYREWIFLIGVITFLFTQLIRERQIRKIKGLL